MSVSGILGSKLFVGGGSSTIVIWLGLKTGGIKLGKEKSHIVYTPFGSSSNKL